MTNLVMLNGKVNLGGALKRLRGKRPRVDIAAISGISAKTIDDIENGRSPNPTIGTLLAICGALDASPIEFLKDAYPDLTKTEPIFLKEADSVSLRDVKSLIDGFGRASDVKKALALLLLSHVRGDSAKHFRDRGIQMSVPAATKLRELLGAIEKLIIDDQAAT